MVDDSRRDDGRPQIGLPRPLRPTMHPEPSMTAVPHAQLARDRTRPAPPAVDVVNLRKEFRRRAKRKTGGPRRRRVAALDGVTFTIGRGETVAILGQNGSGKSTLVHVLSTLLLYESGTATVFGHDVLREARAVRRLVNR